MKTHLEKYVTYLRNVGSPLETAVFDDDWAPIGPNVRAQLKAEGLTVEHGSFITLTEGTHRID